MGFTLSGEISGVEVIAVGKAIRILSKLPKAYGKGRWRKLKGRLWSSCRMKRQAGGVTLVRSTRQCPPRYEDQKTSGLIMPDGRFVLCIRNDGYQASLERRKIYRVIADSQAESKGMLRLVDESGEDYLFPSDYFVPIQVPTEANVAFADS